MNLQLPTVVNTMKGRDRSAARSPTASIIPFRRSTDRLPVIVTPTLGLRGRHTTHRSDFIPFIQSC